jgi:NAD+ synthase (glutamine-hydrolysing)
MAISNKHGNILLNTTNKSEMSVGYGTLYGDLAGGLSVLADIYKTDIYLLADYINKDQEVIPANSINKPPSAELRPGQKDATACRIYILIRSCTCISKSA